MNIKDGKKTALICGVSGQDGAYLAQLLLIKGYRVIGTSRDAQANTFQNLRSLNIEKRITIISMTLTDFRSVLQVLTKYKPTEVYNLAGQSSVGLSFEQPVETLESICIGTLTLLEAIRFCDKGIRLYNAGSSECFGDTNGKPANEQTSFRPRSPYGVAKATSIWEVANYREAYGLYACSGILFNHESPIRSDRFVTQKIVRSACRIASGGDERLSLGRLDIQRDWGWAPEYVEAMWKMLQMQNPEDIVIATGETNSLEQFVDIVFETLGLNWKKHVDVDQSLIRPSDITISRANPAKATSLLGWTAKIHMTEMIAHMINSARKT
jgi:GDPmannose 4,6-dehydratase